MTAASAEYLPEDILKGVTLCNNEHTNKTEII